ncbi:MAG: SDR family oxidoreductase [Planctomycetaceae bacterium]|nr:SDR family oxidoreductase [Planctomycetaceae bacterium]
MIAVTGATGQLGSLVIEHLLKRVPATSVVAIVRNLAKAADLADRGISVRQANYTDPDAFEKALAGVDKLLLVSSSEVGQRAAQHRNVITAAKRAGVKLLVYTSLLRADTSSLDLAPEHVETEAMIKTSGLPYIILRNGWYTENYTASIPGAIAHGAFLGSAGKGRIASAARQDYAEAAAVVLVNPQLPGQVIELAGDTAYTLADLAAEISRQTGKTVPYRDLPSAEYRAVLLQAGLPEGLASGIASWDASAANDALFNEGRQLSRLIGRPTTPLAESVRVALQN